MRAIYIILCGAVAFVAAHYISPLIGRNTEVVSILTTVITVFAGFLVAILTILGDPKAIPKGSWRVAETRRESFELSIKRHQLLFVVYLLAIGALFVGSVAQGVDDTVISGYAKSVIQEIYLSISMFSFFLTFALPFSLGKIQVARIDQEVEVRRGGIPVDALGQMGDESDPRCS